MKYIDISGEWVNEYGSLMRILGVDVLTGQFYGTYESTTGASGKYRVVGLTDTQPDYSIDSQTIAFSVSWRDMGGTPTDANWVSAFSGQIQILQNQEIMTTTYLLQKNTDPQNNWESTIVDKATFTRK